MHGSGRTTYGENDLMYKSYLLPFAERVLLRHSSNPSGKGVAKRKFNNKADLRDSIMASS